MSELAELTKTVENLQRQVTELKQQNDPEYQAKKNAPKITEKFHCAYCRTDFWSYSARASHFCTDEVEAIKEQESRRLQEMLNDDQQVRTVRMVNYQTKTGSMNIRSEEAEALATAEFQERRKRASLAAHDKAMGVIA